MHSFSFPVFLEQPQPQQQICGLLVFTLEFAVVLQCSASILVGGTWRTPPKEAGSCTLQHHKNHPRMTRGTWQRAQYVSKFARPKFDWATARHLWSAAVFGCRMDFQWPISNFITLCGSKSFLVFCPQNSPRLTICKMSLVICLSSSSVSKEQIQKWTQYISI